MRARGFLLHDLRRAYDRMEGGTFSRILACARAPGVHAVAVYRFGSWLLEQNFIVNVFLLPLYLLLNYQVKAIWGISILRRAVIGEGLFVGQWGGIFVSGMAVIGRNCDLSQDVTIDISRYGRQYGYPIIGDNVQIGPGAKIHGKLYIGNNVRIAPNAVIDSNIPENVQVSPTPLKLVRLSPVLVQARQAKAG
jgi:serine O-acetyltransferase